MISINNTIKLVLLLLVLSGCVSRPVVYRAPPQAYQAPVAPVYTPVAPRVQPSISIVNQPTFDKPILQVAITAGYLASDFESPLAKASISIVRGSRGVSIPCESMSLCTVNLADVALYKSVEKHAVIKMTVFLSSRASLMTPYPLEINTEQFMRPAFNILADEVQVFKSGDARQSANFREKRGIYEYIDTNGQYVKICTSNGGSGWVRAVGNEKVFAAKPSIISGCR
jgi:hypothetical protein